MYSHESETVGPEMGNFRIEYCPKVAEPPVFIAGTFTDPPWQQLKMERLNLTGSCEHKFTIRLHIRKGQDHQYKFRVGEAGQWDLNEEEPIVEDDAGNRNNLLVTNNSNCTWREKANFYPNDEVIEEIPLTKFTSEERTKIVNTQAKIDQENQEVEAQNSSSTDSNNSYNTDLRNADGDSDFLVPELPAEPTPTPATESEAVPLHAELNFQKIAQNEKFSFSRSLDVDDQQSNYECEKYEAGCVMSLPDEKSELGSGQLQTRHLDITNDATELADTGNAFDQKLSIPPASNSEIARRLMSKTAVLGVTGNATEMSDVSAILDSQISIGKNPLQIIDEEAERLFGSGHTTPIEDRVPRFSHECPVFKILSEPRKFRSKSLFKSEPLLQECLPHNIDPNDPSIELFPTERASIIAKLKEIQERLPEDEANFMGIPISPVIDSENWSDLSKTEKTPVICREFQSVQSLQPITEEDDDKFYDQEFQVPKTPFGFDEPVQKANKSNSKSNILDIKGSSADRVSPLFSHMLIEITNLLNQIKVPKSLLLKERENMDQSQTQPCSLNKGNDTIEPAALPLAVHSLEPNDHRVNNPERVDKEIPKSQASTDLITLKVLNCNSNSTSLMIMKTHQAKFKDLKSNGTSQLSLCRPERCQDLTCDEQSAQSMSLYESSDNLPRWGFLRALWYLLPKWILHIVKKL